MNFLCRPDAEALLAENDFARLWPFFTNMFANTGVCTWLTDEVKNQYREVWGMGLRGGCNYYRASPLRPPTRGDPAAMAVQFPPDMFTVNLPTLVIWGEADIALPPALVEGLDAYVPHMQLQRVPGATHWIVHEQGDVVARLMAAFLSQSQGT